MPSFIPWNDARNPNPHISWVDAPFWVDLPAECLQNIANGTPSQGTLDLFTYIVQPDLLSSMFNVKDAQFQLLTDSLYDASLGEFSYRAPSPTKKRGRGAGKRSHTAMRDAS